MPGIGAWRSSAPRRQAPPAHLLELGPGRHLLGEQGGLDAVEQPLQPSDELGLGHPQLGVARQGRRAERRASSGQLLAGGPARARRPAR